MNNSARGLAGASSSPWRGPGRAATARTGAAAGRATHRLHRQRAPLLQTYTAYTVAEATAGRATPTSAAAAGTSWREASARLPTRRRIRRWRGSRRRGGGRGGGAREEREEGRRLWRAGSGRRGRGPATRTRAGRCRKGEKKIQF
ncbi:hypothetical protein PVAP13_7KG340870 [Panicum virgatum]|uniref:Uncharacterized protein n=1 Tax=Panicum virgatum TaxID=38727 RepID=A0A8T0QPL4_PANVG|nr:hypothetical protein PVAP13_7KG340870 [Panicum virgatum]